MKRTEIARIFADMEHFDGQDVTVCGWTRTIRDMKNFGFIELNDGSCFKGIQVVFEEGSLENYKEIAKQNVGAALIVQGKVVLTPQAKQPLEYPSAGSMFKRPQGHFAAALIDQCGLKGFLVGGAQVSEKHAGFVINTGQATCQDILTLIRLVRDRVFQQTGVRLEPEVRLLGCTLEEP